MLSNVTRQFFRQFRSDQFISKRSITVETNVYNTILIIQRATKKNLMKQHKQGTTFGGGRIFRRKYENKIYSFYHFIQMELCIIFFFFLELLLL